MQEKNSPNGVEGIKHEEKHRILKHLAEAGGSIAQSDLSERDRRSLYSRIQKLMEAIHRLSEVDECTCEVERETEESMTLDDALECLADGHSLWIPKTAYMICQAVGVPYKKELERHWYSDWSDYKGMHMHEGEEGALGIDALTLSRYVAEQLEVKEKAGSYIGRGFQAQAYAREIRESIGDKPVS